MARAKSGTVMRPRGWKEPGKKQVFAAYDLEKVQPGTRGEVYPLFAAGVVLAFFALAVCYRRGYLLLYGDAVAHLAIARRLVDSHYPGLAQLGGVWLPLPHLLMLPFIRNITMWQTGLAAAPMSMVSYALSVAGIWRLARRMMRLRWVMVASMFYALNPNLLYLATTAMTEALFLALLVWSVVVTMEGAAALRAGNVRAARWRMVFAGLLVLGQVLTRYDGWIVGAAVWACFAWGVWKSSAEVRRRVLPTFILFTVICAAGPLLWFWYNQHFEHDWLDFMRGPYSAAAIDRKTSPAGQHYREWHHPLRALTYYSRTAQIDAAAWETGFMLAAAALYGVWLSWRRRGQDEVRARGEWMAILLWVPLPFYWYSVAYGSVPIFIPQLYPHSYYNARYGMEMLPALAAYGALAAEQLETWLRGEGMGWWKLGARVWQPVVMMLCVVNSIAMMYSVPLVLKEGMVNSTTRVGLEKQIATVLEFLPANEPVMMALSAHVGAVQTAGRTLASMVSENDSEEFARALADPAHNAAFVIALAGDPVSEAVAKHPEGLSEIEVVCNTGQPCARIYQSTVWKPWTAQ
jgi:hypothetical protein